MITLALADADGLRWAQATVTERHYRRSPVDVRGRLLVYLVRHPASTEPMGCLIFSRPEATRCYQGRLTYGSQADVASGRAQYDRWELVNLARVWLDPTIQRGTAPEASRPGAMPWTLRRPRPGPCNSGCAKRSTNADATLSALTGLTNVYASC